MPRVTSICAALEREVILGYSNGFVLSVHIKEGRQKHQLIAATLFEHLDVPPAVQHIKTSIIDKLVFISYVNYSEGQKVIKLKACPMIIFDSETGKYL